MKVPFPFETQYGVSISLLITILTIDRGLIAAIVRAIGFFQNPVGQDIITAIPVSIYSMIETGMYLIAACIPAYHPLYSYAKRTHLFTFGRNKASKDDEELQRIKSRDG